MHLGVEDAATSGKGESSRREGKNRRGCFGAFAIGRKAAPMKSGPVCSLGAISQLAKAERKEEVPMTTDLRLVKKGMREPREGLVQQARVQVALAIEYEEPLKPHGWLPRDTDRLRTGLALLDTVMSRQADERGLSLQATRDENESIDAAKGFIRRLRFALPRALRETSATGVSEESFAVHGKLHRSTPQISAYLTRILPAVMRLDADLAPFFGGSLPSKELITVKKRLDAADTLQEMQLASLPLDTARVYEAKGRVLEDIEDLNRAGKSAFDGNAMMVARFNKDLIRRAQKKRKVTGVGEVSGDTEGEGMCQVEMKPAETS